MNESQYLKNINRYYTPHPDNKKIVMNFKKQQLEILANINLEKVKQKIDQQKLEDYKKQLKEITQQILNLRNKKIEKDSINTQKTARKLEEAKQIANYELRSEEFELFLQECFISVILELKGFDRKELSSQQKTTIKSTTNRDHNNLIRHIELHFNFRDKYNTDYNIYKKLKPLDLEEVLDYLYKLSNKTLEEIQEIKNVGELGAKNIQKGLELFFKRINYIPNSEE